MGRRQPRVAEVTIRLKPVPDTVNSLDIGSPPFAVDTGDKVGACRGFVKRAFTGPRARGLPHDRRRHPDHQCTRSHHGPGAGPSAEAVAIAGNRILRVGSSDDVAGLKAKHTRVIDAGMKTVMPGIIEGHVHLFGGSVELELADAQRNQRLRRDCRGGYRPIARRSPDEHGAARHRASRMRLRRTDHAADSRPDRLRHSLHRRLLRPPHHVGQYQGAGGSGHHEGPRTSRRQRDRARPRRHRHGRTARARGLHAGAGADPHASGANGWA